MAAGYIPPPVADESATGPCAPDCYTWLQNNKRELVFGPGESHPDCAQLRSIADSTCVLCEKSIGYDTRFYVDPDNSQRYVHYLCLHQRELP